MAADSTQSNSQRRYRYSEAPAVVPQAPDAVAAGLPPNLPLQMDDTWRWVWLVLAAAGVGIWLLFSMNLQHLVERWTHDAGWSHGFVVPLISLFFVHAKWDVLRQLQPSGSIVGLAVALVAVCGQVLFRATGLEHMSFLSIPLLLFGVFLFVFGWEYMKILWLPIGFLVFALPPPTTLYVAMTTPMQKIAAELGVQLLPLFGGEGVRSGTVIDVIFGTQKTQLFIAQACAGMRLLVAFFALAVALGYSTDRPTWQKVTLAMCALPIAILCNGLRVTMTGVLSVKVSPSWAEGDAHGFFGLAMLVPAMLLQLGVAWILDRMFVETPESAPGGGA
jgi:exosortase